MKRVIIFDFNRTIFDPETARLTKGSRKVLKQARALGYELVLLAQAKDSRRELIEELDIARYFSEVILTDQKSEGQFKDIAESHNADLARSFVVGDRAQKEIILGHKAGWRTIWLRTGKFSNELPDTSSEPDFTVTDLARVLDHL